MDLVDLISEKRFLGQEFLTWLWFKSDMAGGAVTTTMGDIGFIFEKHMLLEMGEGESHEKVICQGLQAELKEARTGLRMGKKLEQARIHMIQGEYEWHMTLKASLLEFRSMKTPKTMAGTEEGDDDAAVEGRILDKIGLLETGYRIVDELLMQFIKLRIGSEWPTELTQIQKWVQQN
jgi:recombination associated protein RdgC